MRFLFTLFLFLLITSGLSSQALDHSAKYINWENYNNASKIVPGTYQYNVTVKAGSCNGLYESAKYTIKFIVDNNGIKRDRDTFQIISDATNKANFRPAFYSFLKDNNLDITVMWSYSKDSGETRDTPVISWADGDKTIVSGTKEEKVFLTDGGKATLIATPDGKLSLKDSGEDRCPNYSGVEIIN
ncbi:MAG: hypothetical protein WCQ47_07445 [bacterium]